MNQCGPFFALGAWASVGTGLLFLACAYLIGRRPTTKDSLPVASACVGAIEAEDEAMDYEQGELQLTEKKHPELVKRLRATARALAVNGREITTDDIWDAHPIPDGIEGRIMGSVFYPRADWECVGYEKSRRSEKNHGRRVARWRLREKVDA